MTWVLSVPEGVDKDKVRELAPEYLPLVEREGFSCFTGLDARESRMRRAAGLAPTVPQCVEDICYKLGIVNAATIPGPEPRIIVLGAAKGAAVDPAPSRL
jgi:hypothetical protein